MSIRICIKQHIGLIQCILLEEPLVTDEILTLIVMLQTAQKNRFFDDVLDYLSKKLLK